MSLLIPSNLSGDSDSGGKRPSRAGLDEAQPRYLQMPQPYFDAPINLSPSPMAGYQNSHGKLGASPTPKKSRMNAFPEEFDEQGTELGKEARFWKTYVEETDRWDTERINGWNKSLDVILVFAALFSAIATAFLIESSKKLEWDQAEKTAETLLILSQTMIATANNLPPPGLDALSNVTAKFKPTYNSVVINALWYLSLIISLATAFIAALAKEWCYSLLDDRTGDFCAQARRRQRKWTMIENWRMEELITLLPTFIHVALLLFSIGLCIHVNDLNGYIAIPVLCVTTAAVGFYACSSLVACFLEFFPYMTIVSKTMRSKVIRPWIKAIQTVFHVIGALLGLIVFKVLVHAESRTGSHPWLGGLFTKSSSTLLIWALGLIEALRSKDADSENPNQDKVTSHALSWMLNHCKVPHSIDITLQAIAGATQGLPLQPLKDCQAALKISKRLVSGSLYDGSKDHQRRMNLYVRALGILAPSGPQRESTTELETIDTDIDVGDWKAVLWELQSHNENSSARLMVDSQFLPTRNNVSALRTGSMAASHIVLALNRNTVDGRALFAPIIQLIKQHLENSPLHPASMLSLINAASMLHTFGLIRDDATALPTMCLEVLSQEFSNIVGGETVTTEEETQIPRALVACILLQNKLAIRSGPIGNASLKDILSKLVDLQGLRALTPALTNFISFGTLEILTNPSVYNVDPQRISEFALLKRWAKNGCSAISPTKHEHRISHNHFDVLEHLKTLRNVFTLAQLGSPHGWAYTFVVETMCRVMRVSTSGSNDVGDHCGYLLSKFFFPKLSEDLVENLEEQETFVWLMREKNDQSSNWIKSFFATSQLWQLYTLYLDHSLYENADSASLLDRLKRCIGIEEDSQIEEARWQMGEQIEGFAREINAYDGSLGTFEVYCYRVLECVLQARNYPGSDGRWNVINNKLAHTPLILRGLSSFTQLPMRSPLAGAPKHIAIQISESEPRHIEFLKLAAMYSVNSFELGAKDEQDVAVVKTERREIGGKGRCQPVEGCHHTKPEELGEKGGETPEHELDVPELSKS